MKSTRKIVDSIDSRLRELGEEIKALNTARSALDAGEHRSSPRPSRNATKRRGAAASASSRIRTSARSERKASSKVSHESVPPSRERTRRTARPKVSRTLRALSADRLESLLSEHGGLTTSVLAEQANGNRDQVLKLLRELETAGRIRRTGQRRGTRWHAITDEDRIRERAAQLEASRKRRA